MKRICVFSDSHGYADHMLRAVGRERPDLVVHLGDGEADLLRVRERFPDLPIENVRGNCDWHSTAPTVLRTMVADKRIFAAHGHEYNVKLDPGLTRLRFAAMEDQADIVLYGHTHIPYREHSGTMELLNPGSCGDTDRPTYGIITIDGDKLQTEIREAI